MYLQVNRDAINNFVEKPGMLIQQKGSALHTKKTIIKANYSDKNKTKQK